MRHVTLAALVYVALATPAGAQTTDAALMAPIQKFVDSFNKGDATGALATHAASADLVIVDEVPPFIWHGATAFQAWSSALDSESKKQGISDESVTLGRATRTESAGDQAYVIVPAVYNFKQRGMAMRETAQMTFVLKKSGNGSWLIHGWTWTGPKPEASSTAATP